MLERKLNKCEQEEIIVMECEKMTDQKSEEQKVLKIMKHATGCVGCDSDGEGEGGGGEN